MKILNLYAGIGGNRKLWGDEHEITAVEYDVKIAECYKKLFPNDNVIVADAHEYLRKHFREYDFIWASPPCPTHSVLQLSHTNDKDLKYPVKGAFIRNVKKTVSGGVLIEHNIFIVTPKLTFSF